MQFVDLTRQIKDGVILHLSSYPRLNTFVPRDNIYAMQVPANIKYPYIRFGTPITTPYEASCWRGTTCRMTLDAYAEGGPEAEAGETSVMLIKAHVVEAMNHLHIDGLSIIGNEFLGAREVMVDSEADRWRSIIEYNVTAVFQVT